MLKIRNQYGRGLRKPPLDEGLILSWADAYFERNGEWPKVTSGPILESPGENWSNVHQALLLGLRGLLPHSSLALLLQERRNVFHVHNQPSLDLQQVLAWADGHLKNHGAYPKCFDGPIDGCLHERWLGIDTALRRGTRGFPGGSSLAELLLEHRGRRKFVVPRTPPPNLSEEMILDWADSYLARHGQWPTARSGAIDAECNESWSRIDSALLRGTRGFPGRSSLADFLQEHRGKRKYAVPRDPSRNLSEEMILDWADSYLAQHGHWPGASSGPVDTDHKETWSGIDAALRQGGRGLPGDSSLPRLLSQRRTKVMGSIRPLLSVDQISAWLQSHYSMHGRYPSCESGHIIDAPSETWAAIEKSLEKGYRGLPGGSSLAKLKKSLIDSGARKA